MTLTTIARGNEVKLGMELFNAEGALADATVTLTATNPLNEVLTLTPTHVGTGKYSATVIGDPGGRWVFRWVSSGAVIAALPGVFWVSN